MDISNLTPQQLRKAADLQEQIRELHNGLNQLLGNEAPTPAPVAATGAREV
jgi:hypothetical protein